MTTSIATLILRVIGGGPAGLTAAYEAASLGCRVTLIDDQPELGGHLRFQTGTYDKLWRAERPDRLCPGPLITGASHFTAER